MVIGIIAGLQGITDEELNELALAVTVELSRRQAEKLSAPEPEAETLAATSQAEAIAWTSDAGVCGTTRVNVATCAMRDGCSSTQCLQGTSVCARLAPRG